MVVKVDEFMAVLFGVLKLSPAFIIVDTIRGILFLQTEVDEFMEAVCREACVKACGTMRMA